MRLASIVFALSIAATSSAAGAETWLCIADLSTGFKYDELSRKWRTVSFDVEKKRYIIKQSENPQWAWEIRNFGSQSDSYPLTWCNEDFNDAGLLHCTGLGSEFKFNKHSQRYLTTYLLGYWTYNPNSEFELVKQDGGDTPLMEIGTCSLL